MQTFTLGFLRSVKTSYEDQKSSFYGYDSRDNETYKMKILFDGDRRDASFIKHSLSYQGINTRLKRDEKNEEKAVLIMSSKEYVKLVERIHTIAQNR